MKHKKEKEQKPADEKQIETDESVKLSEELTRQKDEAMELIVKMKGGKEFATAYQYPMMRGYPDRPLSHEELIEKYWNNLNFCGKIAKNKAEKALDMIENLEKVDHVRDLVKLLTA